MEIRGAKRRWRAHYGEGVTTHAHQSGNTCIAAALQHMGIVLQPSFLVGKHLASGALVEVMPQFRSIEFGVYVAYPSRRHLTPKVRALVDFLVDAFRMRAWPE